MFTETDVSVLVKGQRGLAVRDDGIYSLNGHRRYVRMVQGKGRPGELAEPGLEYVMSVIGIGESLRHWYWQQVDPLLPDDDYFYTQFFVSLTHILGENLRKPHEEDLAGDYDEDRIALKAVCDRYTGADERRGDRDEEIREVIMAYRQYPYMLGMTFSDLVRKYREL